ncbi:hypothetical protein [Rhodococcus sovatensis]|uniref:Uncharacterized protein n=1 Tax=Rhodococcus sovatensis TaxID=1805840 RepID=A0ABZ2PNM0_9NOCA
MGFFDAGKMDGFTQGLSTLMQSLGGADWSQVTEGLSGAASAFGQFLGSIDGQAVADGIQGITGALTDLTSVATGVSEAFNVVNDGLKNLSSMGGKEGRGLMDFLSTGLGFNNQAIQDSWTAALDGLSGGAAQEIPVKIKPEFDSEGMTDLLAPGQEIVVPVRPEIQGEMAALPPAPLPIDLLPPAAPPELPAATLETLLNPPAAAPAMPPATLETMLLPPAAPVIPPVELTAGPIAPPAPPPPVPVDIQVADGQITVPPPPPIPVTFDVTQPTLNLSVPPVPITFNVSLPQISIPPVEANAFVTVSSNASQVAAEISSLGSPTNSTHTVNSNVADVVGEINSLNGQNTSSTHTINVVQVGATGPGAPR